MVNGVIDYAPVDGIHALGTIPTSHARAADTPVDIRAIFVAHAILDLATSDHMMADLSNRATVAQMLAGSQYTAIRPE
jgi:hypothetical protein